MEERTTSDFMVEKQSLHVLTNKTKALFTETALRTSNITQSLRLPNVAGETKCSCTLRSKNATYLSAEYHRVCIQSTPLRSYAPIPAPSPPFKTIFEVSLQIGLQNCRCISPDVIIVTKMTSIQYFLYLWEQKEVTGA